MHLNIIMQENLGKIQVLFDQNMLFLWVDEIQVTWKKHKQNSGVNVSG